VKARSPVDVRDGVVEACGAWGFVNFTGAWSTCHIGQQQYDVLSKQMVLPAVMLVFA